MIYDKQETEWFFPVPLWRFRLVTDRENINKNIEKRIYEKYEGEKTRSASNEGGWHSVGNMHDDPVMEPIIILISHGINELNYESNMNYTNYKIFLWSNLNRPGDYNSMHAHPDCHLSGAYYVKVPEGDCGKLRLYNPMYFYNYPNSQNSKPPYTSGRVDIKSEEGTLLIFRSPIMHDVTRNNTQEDRISVSFNIVFDSNLYK